ncbi:MAG: hypothetical protein FJW38_30265 [Acidobacteria bacterium]|nr:hypothetical protein [Acidobacteriota bacterium]
MENEKLSKAEQARINGAKSTGPKTPEGLQRCRQASVKHGMWVAHISTFPHENQIQYAAVLTALNDQFNPRNFAEAAMVGLLADAMWRAHRLSSLANSDIDRQMWLIQNQSSVQHEPHELHLLAEQASKSVHQLEARARHYTREINRIMDIIRKLQALPVSSEASQVMKEMLDLVTKDVPPPSQPEAPKPPAEPLKPAPPAEPARKPVQSAKNKPQEGSVPRRK